MRNESQLRAAVLAGAFLVASSLVASFATAAPTLSPKYTEWRNGPAQWIMTSEEKRAWKTLATDQEASNFIDLFWARRDPSPGTPQNEALETFEALVRFADDNFKEGKRRGAMTDRGRVFIVLGTPPGLNLQVGHNSGQSGGADAVDAGLDVTGGHDLGAKDVWMWGREEALKKFGIPKVEVVFISDPIKRTTTRDPQRGDFSSAEAAVMKRQIITPNLTKVPEWALYGGLDPKVPQMTAVTTEQSVAPMATVGTKPAGTATPVAPQKIVVTTGASRLTITKDVMGVDTQALTDPISALKTASVFREGDTLGWATQYCSGTDDTPVVRFTLHLTAKIGGKNIDRATPEDEMMLERVKLWPGCYLLRGELPVEGITPGNYQLQIAMQDVESGKKFAVAKEFVVE